MVRECLRYGRGSFDSRLDVGAAKDTGRRAKTRVDERPKKIVLVAIVLKSYEILRLVTLNMTVSKVKVKCSGAVNMPRSSTPFGAAAAWKRRPARAMSDAVKYIFVRRPSNEAKRNC